MGGIISKPISDTLEKEGNTSRGSISQNTTRKPSFGDDFTDCSYWKYMGVSIKSRLLFRNEVRNPGSGKNKWIWKVVEVVALDFPDKIKIHFEGKSPVVSIV
jgi:hypothetical protein